MRASDIRAVAAALLLAAVGSGAKAWADPPHDVVLAGARVIDPESGLDAIRNIAVRGDRIVAVTESPIEGKRTIDASGLVAAPGFIDLHSHATDALSAGYQAKDGVTTRLELEIGTWPVAGWYAAKQGHELLNYGTSVGHTLTLTHGPPEAFPFPFPPFPRSAPACPDSILIAASSLIV